ncbi:MAG: dTMP kinase [Thermoproteota archaeon]
MKRPGKHIAFEGIDGAGKTSISSKVFMRLREEGVPCHYTYEPTNSRIGSYIRLHISREGSLPPSFEALLYAADRVQHYYGEIHDYISKGYIVISDRYVHSSIAYQGTASGDVDWVSVLNKTVPAPDLAIYLKISPRLALLRKSGKRRTVYEREGFLRKVVKVYDELANKGLLTVVDASKPFDNVFKESYAIVKNFIKESSSHHRLLS